jgi:hypothetical protein
MNKLPLLEQRCNGTPGGLGYLEVSWIVHAILPFWQSADSYSSTDFIHIIKLIISAPLQESCMPYHIKATLIQQTSSEILT